MSQEIELDARPKWRETVISAIKSSTVARSFVAGTFTGVCSTFLFQPLDLIKTRIQSQLLTGLPNNSELFKVYPIVRQVLREEGATGLWRGTVPSLYRTVPGVGIYFSSIHFMQEVAGPDCNPACFLMIGIASRFIASLSVLPFTVIKARSESGLFKYSSVFGAMRTTISTEGFRSLYSGFVPTLLRDAPFSGIYLAFYEMIKSSLRTRVLPDSSWTPALHFGSGVTAGLLASVVTHPFDVIKTQIQLTSDSQKRGLFYSARTIWKNNGAAGYFAGVIPRIARRTLMTATSWTVYEQVIRSTGLLDGRRKK
ncbi:Solute carrier family 25 member 38 [Hypsibius exemplaris]|uniref:Mitochondrial glycine transporter n=1 Tax=Hypsibius exemplaris TaxID=2072580 RepID=A0A1W0XDF0_HYPEX|nr:Solute carrier family 25 member 38 [Hypsibius exemplaris]